MMKLLMLGSMGKFPVPLGTTKDLALPGVHRTPDGLAGCDGINRKTEAGAIQPRNITPGGAIQPRNITPGGAIRPKRRPGCWSRFVSVYVLIFPAAHRTISSTAYRSLLAMIFTSQYQIVWHFFLSR